MDPAVRHHGRLLTLTTEAVVAEIGEQFLSLSGAPPDEVLRALAEDHLTADPYLGLREGSPDVAPT